MPGGEARFHAVFAGAPLGVALSRPDGTFTDVNANLRELFTGTGVDLDTGSLTDLVRNAPENSDEAMAWRNLLVDVLAGRIPAARVELPIDPTVNPPRWVRATTAVVVLGGRRYLLSHFEETTARRWRAHHDELTGLANRALLTDLFLAATARGKSSGLRTGVLYLDLDDFARVNEMFGHDAGDVLLVAVAQRLRGVLRVGDTVGRLEDARFAVVAPDMAGDASPAALARRIDRQLAAPLDLGRARLRISVSIGDTIARSGDTFAAALGRAEQAMSEVRMRRSQARSIDLRNAELRDTELRETDLRDTERPA